MNVYIKAQESVCLVHPEIKIKDIMSLYCTDKDLEQKIKNQSVYCILQEKTRRIKDFSLWKDSLCDFSRIFWCKFFNYDI